MKIFSEKRDIKPGVWGDSILESLAIQVEGKDDPVNPAKKSFLLESLEFGDVLDLNLIFTDSIEIPTDKNTESLHFAVWMYRKSGTERNNKLIFKKNFSKIDHTRQIKLPSIKFEDAGRTYFNLRVGILEKASNPDLPPFIAGEKIFRIVFEPSSFPTSYCKFTDMNFPAKAIWNLGIDVDDPEEPLYTDQGENVMVYLNEEFPDFVRLTRSSAARNPELKVSHRILMDLLHYEIVLQLSEWVLNFVTKKKDSTEFDEDSIGYIVLNALKKFLKCGNHSEIIDLYNDDSARFRMLLQEATKLSDSFKLRSNLQ